jgi:SAM-dependent methyltransferase
MPQHPDVLEIGPGDGSSPIYTEGIHDCARLLAGVDPDPAIARNPHLDERYQCDIETFASQQDRRTFDIVYSYMVIEHVADPQPFLSSICKVLRPGGAFFAATPNLTHYFGLASYVTQRIGLQEWLLYALRGRATAEGYHCSTHYRMNTLASLTKQLRLARFCSVEFRMLEHPPDFACYFPRPLRFAAYAHSRLVYALKAPSLMGTIMFKATRGHSEGGMT